MARKKKEQPEEVTQKEKAPRQRSKSYSRTKGHNFETKIARELRELGFDCVVTSRSESKRMDDKKVDLIDTCGVLPCYIQLKKTQTTPSYFNIKDECGLTDMPFVIIWSKDEKKEVNIVSRGEVAIVPKQFFYELLKKYCELDEAEKEKET